ncbi:MAG: GHKL domain-containing protein [Anaerolineales bacterium]|nr:GHKL domain-containing protein [Anaerolineales bacterium]
MKRPQSIRTALIQFVIVPLVVAMLISFAVLFFAGRLLRDSILARQRLTIQTLAVQSEQFIAETDNLMQALNILNSDEEQKNQFAHFSQVRNTYARFDAFYILDENGTVILEDSDSFSLLGLDLSGENFFMEGQYSQTTYYSDPFISLTSGQATVTAAIPMQENGGFSGVLVGEINLEALQQAIEGVDLGEGGTSFIIDQQGALVAHPNSDWVQERRNFGHLPILTENLTAQDTYKVFYDEIQGEWVIGSAATIAENWLIVVLQPALVAFRPLILLGLVSITLLGLSFVLFLSLELRYLSGIISPISLLAERAEALAEGEYENLPLARMGEYEEIVSLGHSFTQMVDAVQERDRFLEQRVRERTAQLEDLNKELEAFAYSISHDLRAPLRAINGYSKILVEDYADSLSEEHIQYLEKILDQSNNMDDLINALLTLSRMGRRDLKIEALNLSETVEKLFDGIFHEESDHEIDFTVSSTPAAQADDHLMTVLLTNLLSNAVKFTRGCVPAVVEFGAQDQEGEVAYYVRDNGVGFNMQYANKLFSPFQRLHTAKEFEGTGIGLAIVRRVVKRHGGRVWIESEENEGTTVYFTLGDMDGKV